MTRKKDKQHSGLKMELSKRVGLSMFFDSRGDAPYVGNVLSALMDAGVPAYKIQTSEFVGPNIRRNGQVAELVYN